MLENLIHQIRNFLGYTKHCERKRKKSHALSKKSISVIETDYVGKIRVSVVYRKR